MTPEVAGVIGQPVEPIEVTLSVNGRDVTANVEPRLLLVDFLRHNLGLTGTHVGCEHGVCGACTIRFDGELARSCLMLAAQAAGHELETVESLSDDGTLHPIQQAFNEAHALQCGFCTPAMLLTTQQLLRDVPDANDREIREYLSGNVCRCTGYMGIVAAVKLARERQRSARPPDRS
ncbi:MAG TPA: (2Fe-2S)-binding protein [Solirubrobacteraceae bacterium]|nr:(2Fe-2S)-binding protein [Solirubrobacteraceae bacterium]